MSTALFQTGDTVTWNTRYGYRSRGVILAVEDGIATVNTVGYVRANCPAITRVPVQKLEPSL